ncbi:MAG TPA: UDP-N-acetylmuramoyl-tripeptide--D-alanyl-D-alanine ligase [Steroidobacteraceae bacterium]
MRRTLHEFAAAAGGQLLGADAPFINAVIDSRTLAAGDLFLALPGTQADGHDFVAAAAAAGAAGAVVSRAQPVTLPQIQVGDVASALTAAGAHWRASFTGPLIGVAGSNGKTTAKEMLGAVLSQSGACLLTRGNLNNHLGVPLTLLRLQPATRWAVIEMGANRAGDVAALAALARPAIGLITSAGAEHLEGFGSIEGAARAEGELVAALPPDGVAVLNADDPYYELWRQLTGARIVSFGFAAGADVRAEELQLEGDAHGFVSRFVLRSARGGVPVRLALAGRHNVRNALGAAAAALSAGCDLQQVAAGLGAVQAVPGRLQLRPGRSGAWLIDDSYNANPSSLRAALEVLSELPGRRWLVLGDMAELGDFAAASHREAGELARASGVERLFTHGPLAALAAGTFGAGAEAFGDADSLARALSAALQSDVRLLIKGSRVNRLERVVAAVGAPEARRAG